MYAVTPAGVRMEWGAANRWWRFAYHRLIAETPPGSATPEHTFLEWIDYDLSTRA